MPTQKNHQDTKGTKPGYTGKPQRHRDTEKAQSPSQTRRHKDTKTSQRRRASTRIQRVARSWPPNGDQGPLERAPVPIASDRHWSSFQRPALGERRPRHFSPLFNDWKGHTSFPDWREARRNRRAPGASAGGKPGCNERLRSEQSGFLPAVGDRQIAGCSAVNPRRTRITSATNPLCLRVFVFAMSFSVFLLCVSVPLWFSRFRTAQRS